jgi:hypothetical protein
MIPKSFVTINSSLFTFASIFTIIVFIIAFTVPFTLTAAAADDEQKPAAGAQAASKMKNAFMEAVKKGDLGEVKKLVEGGVDVNAKFIMFSLRSSGPNDYTAVMEASAKGHAGILNYLLEKGADAGAMDSMKRGAWDYAEANGQKKILDILKAKGIGPSENTKAVVEKMRLDTCKVEMDNILMALELCDMEGAIKPTITLHDLAEGKYIKKIVRCPMTPDEDYMIVIQGQKNQLQFDVKCRIHGSLKELSGKDNKK